MMVALLGNLLIMRVLEKHAWYIKNDVYILAITSIDVLTSKNQ